MSIKETYPKTIRLHHSQMIREVFEQGIYQSLGPIGVKYKIIEAECSLFAISVKKKVGSAPCRNRIKRLLKEAIRKERLRLNCAYNICFFITSPPKSPLDSSYVLCLVRQFFKNLNKESSE